MNIDQKVHSETDFITLSVALVCNMVLRKSPPIAEIYLMERLTKSADAAAVPVSNTSVRRLRCSFKWLEVGWVSTPPSSPVSS